MPSVRLVLAALPLAALAACTVNPRPVVVTTPPPVVQATPAPPVVMGAPAAVTIDVPPGQYPAPGSCRIWVPGVAPANQAPSGACDDLQNRVPAGAVLLRG
ncbi:hypothetical protein [Ramlibacter humi]|uniref:Uncharacterized protein n=1 Tax=Ramlibacter humi TaxID=2530451 RepID=A0A4Z0CBY1_9BURK|nr:hypothetical protein [Ramlibacter humi]TFZ07948.1 hypothetical protein EZ216_01925 [Ramlibacter humi]